VEKGVAVFKKLGFLLGLPTIKVFSSDVFFFPRLMICERF
jgi:hypothetical protein